MNKKYFYPLIIFFAVLIFFSQFFLQGKLPIPSDTIIGLYHPFRDLYAKNYPNGIPYKNFLITDPVRQQIPWRLLGIEAEKKGQLPLWNPYSLGGSPLAGTLQGAVFYPLNVLFFILPFGLGWSLLIILQPLLAGIFLYFYLKNLKLHSLASLLGSITFAFCGFSIAWLEWGMIVQIVLWLPLLLLAIDNLFDSFNKQIFQKPVLLWSLVFVFSLSSSLLAGHLQIFFYVYLITVAYFAARWIQLSKSIKIFLLFLFLNLGFILITFIQWYPTLQLIMHSARDIDQINWQQAEGWFVPWQHLIQFVAPDFFGNPTTLNYWGTWNYGELVGYVGLVPLIMAIFALIFRRDKKTLFFGLFLFSSLLFALPTFIAKLPYSLNIPFLSTSQPTRLLFITDFSLAILGALGLDHFLQQKNKKMIILPLGIIGLILGALWIFVTKNHTEDMLTAKHNLYFPLVLFVLIFLSIVVGVIIKNKKINFILINLLIIITLFDLIRFGQKFTPFTNKEYLFPPTQALTFLQNDHSQFRIMSTDSRILPPNFSMVYHLQNIAGYDPLYLRRYGELIAASERGKPDIHPPFGFNRIITPTNIDSKIINLLGVKYILSFNELKEPRFVKVDEEGQTKVYENKEALPRAFFVTNIKFADSKQEAINDLFDNKFNLRTTAVVENQIKEKVFSTGKVKISEYSENKVVLQTQNAEQGFLLLTDTFYPTWHAKICSAIGDKCVTTQIYLTDYNFRGVIIPAGKHSVIFYNSLL